MKNQDLVSSLVWMLLGCLFVAGALQQGLMRRGVPGPGFLPFVSGLALIFVSLFVFSPALGRKEMAKSKEGFFPERDSRKKFLSALAALVAYGVGLVYAGYLLTTFLFMFFVTWIMEPAGWRTFAVLAFLTAVISHLLFVVLLEVQLPKGFLGF